MAAGDKSQGVRLVDVFLLGPFMIGAGARSSTLPAWMRVGLVGAGVGTVGYNLVNYLTKRDVERDPDVAELVCGVQYELEHGAADFDEAKRLAVEQLGREPRYYSELARCELEDA